MTNGDDGCPCCRNPYIISRAINGTKLPQRRAEGKRRQHFDRNWIRFAKGTCAAKLLTKTQKYICNVSVGVFKPELR